MKDPVCGMEVNPDSAAQRETHGNQEYYFCCRGCAAKFRADPVRYLARTPSHQLTSADAPRLVQLGPAANSGAERSARGSHSSLQSTSPPPANIATPPAGAAHAHSEA